MARLKAVVAYDGTKYQGWQRQTNGLGIQQVLEEALSGILKEEVKITASGRTDAGVHAQGQVFHFTGRPDINYPLALNALLPKDIQIQSVQLAAEDFHARFSAKKKRYDYFIRTKTDPFNYKYCWKLQKMPDLEKMKAAARIFVGTHDFTSFCDSKVEKEKDKVRTIEEIDLEMRPDGAIHLSFLGNGFLRYQVRMMTGAIVACGQGKITADDIRSMMEARNKHANRFCAPAQGLFLTEVFYEQ